MTMPVMIITASKTDSDARGMATFGASLALVVVELMPRLPVPGMPSVRQPRRRRLPPGALERRSYGYL
jgi:hypothetical protein